MADRVPIQVKIRTQEFVKIEFEIQNIVQQILNCKGPLSALDTLNLQVKQRISCLKRKIEVQYN